jgi:glycosyltransferase involved in cell wall biosynthesis
MRKKKIVHVISSLKIGGAESLLYDLIVGLGSEQYEHHVIFFHDGPNAKRLQELGIPVYHIKGLICMYDPLFFWRLHRTIKKLKPDVIHSALWAANLAARIIVFRQGIPLVSAVHLGVDLDGRIRNLLDQPTFGLARHIIAVSEGVKKSLQDKGWVDDSSITVIPNGIDPQAIVERSKRVQVTRADLGLTDEHIVIGSVGRFIPRKNYSLLLESFASVYARCNQARLMLVGLGPQEQQLRAQAKNLGIDAAVIFVVGKSAYSYFPLFDCFVLSSHQEGLSIALLEALCFKLPCIVTSSNENHEVIQHNQTGLIALPTVASLAEQLMTYCANKNVRLHIGNEGHKMLKDKFNLLKMIDAYRNVFEHAENH